MKKFRTYGDYSNSLINYAKSEALNITLSSLQKKKLIKEFTFRWAPQAISYLRILLPSVFSQIYLINFPPLLKKIRVDLRAWSPEAFLLSGRGNVIKQSILPKILYKIRALPVFIPQFFFKKLDDYFWLYLGK